MSLTKKEYLEKKYIEFSNDVGKILGTNLFPSLDELCMIDILLYFQYTFWNMDDYREIIQQLLSFHHPEFTPDQFEQIYPIVEKYINDLKDFLKVN
jgi:hypothetical protein